MGQWQKQANFLMVREGCNCLALIHILEENAARVALNQSARTCYYTIWRGEIIDSGVQELRRTTEHLMGVYARKVDLIVILKQIIDTSDQKWETYQEGFNINLAVDQRVEREARRVSAIMRQAEMQTALSELTIQERHDWREAVTKA